MLEMTYFMSEMTSYLKIHIYFNQVISYNYNNFIYGDWIMNIFICDDDNLICNQIKSLCEKYYIEHKINQPDIYTFHSGEDMLASSIRPDIVYLDIQMSGMDGITVGNTLLKSYPAAIIIIVTSFPEYLDDAMRFHVFRYISKPLEEKRFMRNFEDAIS